VRNIFDEGFFSSYHLYDKDSDDSPEKLHRRIDIGSAWEGPGTTLKPRLLLDFRDILMDDLTFRKSFKAGVELKYDLGRGLNGSVQMGESDGYYTAGLGLQSLFVKLEFVTYAEDYGTTHSHLTNRQYMAQFNVNF
jgi:hypothetical protein